MNKDLLNLENYSTNIYRTKFYIIKQVLSFSTCLNGDLSLHSDDFYYLRNKKIDKDYEYKYSNRICLNGKRIHTSTFTKHYR